MVRAPLETASRQVSFVARRKYQRMRRRCLLPFLIEGLASELLSVQAKPQMPVPRSYHFGWDRVPEPLAGRARS